MLLLIDAGNTRVKWALVAGGEAGAAALGAWSDFGAVAHSEVRTLADTWRDRKILRVLVSNVAGQNMRDALEGVLGMQPVPLEWFSSTAELAGIRNAYRQPGQLGCDRFASAIGAHALFPGEPLVVATCGTATTVDAISADGIFMGGMILPGLGLMAGSLARNTAQLPQIAHDIEVNGPFADNTDAAIASGCIAAQTGAIERAVAALTQGPQATVRCLLSGGAAALIAPHLRTPATQIDNLVLTGLHHVAMTT